MVTAIQVLFNGLSLGATLALVAVGLTMVFGVMHVVNFAHGVLVMLGAYVTYYVVVDFGQHYLVALAVSGAVVAIVAALSVTIFQRFQGLVLEGAIAAVLLSIILESMAFELFGATPVAARGPFEGSLQVGGVFFGFHRIVVICVAVIMVTCLHLLVTRTRVGRAIRAAQQDPFAARLQGISVKQVMVVTFALGGLLAGVAGTLVVPQQVLLPSMGASFLVMAFVVVIVGGMGSVKGSLIVAIAIGLLQSAVATYWMPEAAIWLSFAAALVFLALRPQGVFGNA